MKEKYFLRQAKLTEFIANRPIPQDLFKEVVRQEKYDIGWKFRCTQRNRASDMEKMGVQFFLFSIALKEQF